MPVLTMQKQPVCLATKTIHYRPFSIKTKAAAVSAVNERTDRRLNSQDHLAFAKACREKTRAFPLDDVLLNEVKGVGRE